MESKETIAVELSRKQARQWLEHRHSGIEFAINDAIRAALESPQVGAGEQVEGTDGDFIPQRYGTGKKTAPVPCQAHTGEDSRGVGADQGEIVLRLDRKQAGGLMVAADSGFAAEIDNPDMPLRAEGLLGLAALVAALEQPSNQSVHGERYEGTINGEPFSLPEGIVPVTREEFHRLRSYTRPQPAVLTEEDRERLRQIADHFSVHSMAGEETRKFLISLANRYTVDRVTEGEESETVTLASGEPVPAVPPVETRLITERDAFAVLAGWDFEGDGEHRIPWDFERVKKQCLEVQHEDAQHPPVTEGPEFTEWEISALLDFTVRSLNALSSAEVGSEVGQRWLALKNKICRLRSLPVTEEHREKVGFICCNWDNLSPESKRAVEEVVQATADPFAESPLSEAEQKEYEDARRSVVAARDADPGGRSVIASTQPQPVTEEQVGEVPFLDENYGREPRDVSHLFAGPRPPRQGRFTERSPEQVGEGDDGELPEWAKVYSYLCGNCGEIRPAAEYGRFIHDYDGRFGPEGELVPTPEGEETTVDRCPACGFDHEDNDTGPGAWAGSRADMETERAKLIEDSHWVDLWIETWRALATTQPDPQQHPEEGDR